MRIRQHVNPNQLHFARFRGERPVIDERPIELEIGCADAQFLFERAALDPARSYVGLEIREDLVAWVNDKAKKLGAPVHAVFCHAQLHTTTIFPRGAASRVYVNFPDPWFKRRHQKRRLVNDELVDVLHSKLRPGGELFFQSDVFDLALDAMAVLEEASERFANTGGPWSFARDNAYGARSLREVRCEERGVRIWRMCYRRLGA